MSGLPTILGGSPVTDLASHRRWPVVGEDEKRRVLGVLERGVLSGWTAPESVLFEREFAAAQGTKYALLTHSGTSALELCVVALGIGEGDEVIVPAYSFVATPLSVLRAGAVPVFVDVDEATGLIDPALVDKAIGPRTRAIMPVHVHGLPADMDALGAIAKKHSLAIIEDAAQAHLATFGGKGVGGIGECGAFSLQSSKNLCAGEGGLFTTNDAALADRANRVRNFGQDVSLANATFDPERPLDGTRALESVMMGAMFRGNELMAAFARAQLARLPERTASAQRNALRLAAALRELPGVLPPEVPAGRTHVFHKFRVRLDPKAAGLDVSPRALRDAISTALRAEGLEVVMWQDSPLPSQSIFKDRKGFGRGLPWSAAGSRRTDGTFPRTQALIDGSVVLFSQSCPLIAQEATMIDGYVEAFRRVWKHRRAIVDKARAAP